MHFNAEDKTVARQPFQFWPLLLPHFFQLMDLPANFARIERRQLFSCIDVVQRCILFHQIGRPSFWHTWVWGLILRGKLIFHSNASCGSAWVAERTKAPTNSLSCKRWEEVRTRLLCMQKDGRPIWRNIDVVQRYILFHQIGRLSFWNTWVWGLIWLGGHFKELIRTVSPLRKYPAMFYNALEYFLVCENSELGKQAW